MPFKCKACAKLAIMRDERANRGIKVVKDVKDVFGRVEGGEAERSSVGAETFYNR